MKILLAYLSDAKFGGWATFTCHLHLGLKEAGAKPLLVKTGAKTKMEAQSFGRRINYQRVSVPDLKEAAKTNTILITAVDKAHREIAAELLQAGASIVIHDPTELREPLSEHLEPANIIVIRESMLAHLPQATYIPHPYYQIQVRNIDNKKSAAAISRIDFDKRTHTIIEANKSLTEPIDIYGFENRIYSHFKLNEVDPDWKRNYKGTFDKNDLWSATKVASRYERIIDMSVIKGDGGGTQYTFLEAANAGSHLILNEQWQPTGILAEYAHTAKNQHDLIELCQQQLPNKTQQTQQLLNHHNAQTIATTYLTQLT